MNKQLEKVYIKALIFSAAFLFVFLFLKLCFASFQFKYVAFLLGFCLLEFIEVVLFIYFLYQVIECFFNICTIIGAYCIKLTLILFFQFINYRFKFLNLFLQPLRVQKIRFVAQQNFRNLVTAMKHQLLQPHFSIIKRFFVGYIEYDTCGF